MSLCILFGGAVAAALPIEAFTLSWHHTIEKVEWQEDYRVVPGGLRLVEARVRGAGAGMEPPAGAFLRDGWWHYVPDLPLLPALTLANAAEAGEWRLCREGNCRTLPDLAGRPQPHVLPQATLRPCREDEDHE